MKWRRERTVTGRSGLSDRYPPIFEKIADTVIRELPPDWTKTWASAEMEAHRQSGGLTLHCVEITVPGHCGAWRAQNGPETVIIRLSRRRAARPG